MMKGIDKISADELFNRVDSDRTRSRSLRVKKRRVKMVARQGSFTQRVVDAWNGLPGKVVTAKTEDKFKLELDRYLEVMEIEGYRDFGKTFRELEYGSVIVIICAECHVCGDLMKGWCVEDDVCFSPKNCLRPPLPLLKKKEII